MTKPCNVPKISVMDLLLYTTPAEKDLLRLDLTLVYMAKTTIIVMLKYLL